MDLLDDFPQPAPTPRPEVSNGPFDLLGDELAPPTTVVPAQTEAPASSSLPSETVNERSSTAVASAADEDLQPLQVSPNKSESALLSSPQSADEDKPPDVRTAPTDNQDAGPSDPPSAVGVEFERSAPDSVVPEQNSSPGSQSLPSEHDQGEQDEGSGNGSNGGGASVQGSGDDERLVDSDREVVEEEDAFGDFADFTTASHFLPGGGSLGTSTLQPPASASAAARAAGAGPSSATSLSAHRHAQFGSTFPVRPSHVGLMPGGAQGHSGTASGGVSDHGSLGGDFSDFSHPSPPPSVVRAGGGRKSVASIASVGSRAGGDDDLGDYGSVVGSSVWRAPSQMATSSYAAAAGADDDFGDFTSDITSTSDFAPSTQPPSAVAVSGPGSVHPDDDFGSFASHRSTADDDEDDFGNFNAAPAGGGASAAAGGAGPSGGNAGASGSGGAGAAAGSGGVSSGTSGQSGNTQSHSAAGGGGAGVLSPRDGTAPVVAGAYHSTQTVGPISGGAESAAAAEPPLLRLPPQELRQAVARALQPLLPAGSALAAGPQLPGIIAEEQLSAAWAQLRRHVAGPSPRADGGVAAHTGLPWAPLQGPGGAAGAEGVGAAGFAAAPGPNPGLPVNRVGYVSAVKYTRPLRWKGSESERRLLAGLGLSEVAAQARAAEAADGPRVVGRGRSDTSAAAGLRQLGVLASHGDALRRLRAEAASSSAAVRKDTDCDTAAGGAVANGGASRARAQQEQIGEGGGTPGSHPDAVGAGNGVTPRAAAGPANGRGGLTQPQGSALDAGSEGAVAG